MIFKAGMISDQEARELNRLQADVNRLNNIRVAGPTMRLYRGPANMVIESTAHAPEPAGSGSGAAGGGDLVSVHFDYLSDVTISSVMCNADGTITVTLTKTSKRTTITGPDLSISTATL